MKKDGKALILLALIGLCVSSLAGCATPSQVTLPAELIAPPSALLTPCERPKAYALETNQDLAHFASAALLAWEKCAAQIDALRIFYGLGDSGEATRVTDDDMKGKK